MPFEGRRGERVGFTSGRHPHIGACVKLACGRIKTALQIGLRALELDRAEDGYGCRRGDRQGAHTSLASLKLGHGKHSCRAVEKALAALEEADEGVEEQR